MTQRNTRKMSFEPRNVHFVPMKIACDARGIEQKLRKMEFEPPNVAEEARIFKLELRKMKLKRFGVAKGLLLKTSPESATNGNNVTSANSP